MVIDIFDLEAAIKLLAGRFDMISAIYLFGSRRFETGSPRSDIDILIEVESRIKPSDLRDFTIELSTALDLFVLQDGKAISVANESFIEASNNEDLIRNLNAVLLYGRGEGSSDELINRKGIELDRMTQHKLTALPNTSVETYEISALRKCLATAESNHLASKPYLGTNAIEASDFIVDLLRSIIDPCQKVTQRGQAKDGWTNNISSEYDFQNLFWIVLKPWLPMLGREEVEIKYDGQKKYSDFNLFRNQIIIELKHIKNDNDERSIIKTLKGLEDFYLQHSNVKVLIFGILVDKEVDIDDTKLESDYSHTATSPSVRTVVIRNNKSA